MLILDETIGRYEYYFLLIVFISNSLPVKLLYINVFNLDTLCWRLLKPTQYVEGINSHTTTLFEDKFYIFGQVHDPNSALLILDPSTETSEGKVEVEERQEDKDGVSFPSLRLHTATLFQDTLLIFGGATASWERINTLSSLNLKTFEWKKVVATKGIPPAPRSFHTATFVPPDFIVVFGGFFGLEHWQERFTGMEYVCLFRITYFMFLCFFIICLLLLVICYIFSVLSFAVLS